MQFRVSNPPGPGVPQGGKRNPNDIDEPSVSNNGRVVFYTGNWYASESNDSGDTWTFVNPMTIDPNFCCDQHTIYDPVNNITIWEMLSLPDRVTGVNHVKLLVANGQAGVSGGTWHSFDITTSALVAPTGSWLDYPQLGLSQNNLFLTLNGFQGPAGDPGCTSPASPCFQINSYVIRMPLTSLAATGTLPIDFKTYGCLAADCVDTFTPVQQVGATMYFGAHGGPGTAIAPDTNVLRVYEWPDSFSGTQPLVRHDVSDPTGFTYMVGRDGFCPSNGVDVCQRDDSRVHAGWWQQGELDFAWDARQDSSAQFPYVRGAKVNTNTATWTLTRFDLALATAATIYPGIAVNARGGLGLTMVVAGGMRPSPQAVIGISDDLTSGWELQLLQDGTGAPALNGWGDYLTIRPASGTGKSWVATGFTVQGNSVYPVFAWFGRSRDDPFTATGLTCGTAITGAMGAQIPSQVLATFTATSGSLNDYVATIDWGDGSTPSRIMATGSPTAPNGASVSGTHAFASAGSLTVTVSVGPRTYSGVSVSCTLPATITGSVYTTATTKQYQLPNSDGSTWQPIDATHLVLKITPAANSAAILSANADLWTQNAGINQDIGIAVSGGTGPGSYPTVAGQPEAWKESGGFAGTFSPNAAYLQAALPMNAGTTYTITLVWKANKPAAGTTIMAGAGPLWVVPSAPPLPIPPVYSPVRLTAHVIPGPLSPNPNFAQKTIRTQPTFPGSNGSTWQDMDSGLSQSFTAPADGTLMIGGNADLWTANAGYNQDLGVTVSGGVYPSVAGQPETWKESGGYGGTQSPNAAFVQAVVPVKNGVSYQVKLQWKTNRDARSSGAIIVAGAGAIGGIYSPSTMTIQFFASANVVNAAVTSQPVNPSSNGVDFTPIDSNNLSGTIPSSSTADCVAILGGNADLWTANAGYNQDISIWVNGNLLGWKESGGFAGTFSPNAAFVQSVIPVPMNSAPGLILQWKTNIDATSSGARIYAGAGPIGVRFSPTRLSAEVICS
jgi:hypothetical protein